MQCKSALLITFPNFRNYADYASIKYEDIDLSDKPEIVPCDTWDYDESWYLNTLKQKFDLVCDRDILSGVGSSTFFIGTGVGVFIAGLLSDKIGRKKTLLIFIVLFFLSGLGAAFAPTFELWVVARYS